MIPLLKEGHFKVGSLYPKDGNRMFSQGGWKSQFIYGKECYDLYLEEKGVKKATWYWRAPFRNNMLIFT